MRMATPIETSRPLSVIGDNAIDAAIHGYYWRLKSDRTIDWAIANGFEGEYWYSPNYIRDYVNMALSTYAEFANVRFNYVGYYQTPSGAYYSGSEITVSLSGNRTFFPLNGILARGFFPNSNENYNWYPGAPGDLYLNINSEANYLPTYAPGSAGYFLILHELGHTLGLKHPHDDGGTGHPTLNSIGLGYLDLDVYTVMSYKDNYSYNFRQWDPATPMVLDVIAMQYLYGKNNTKNIGNTNYALYISNMYRT